MKKVYYVSHVPGYWWSSNHNIIDFGNAFISVKGKSTDSAIMNPEKNGYGTAGSPLRRPEFKPAFVGLYSDEEIKKHYIKVSKNNSKSYSGIIVNDEYLDKIRRSDRDAIFSIAVPCWDSEGNLEFVVPYFFTDEFVFVVSADEENIYKENFLVENEIQ